jgi:hypothetical protein
MMLTIFNRKNKEFSVLTRTKYLEMLKWSLVPQVKLFGEVWGAYGKCCHS